MTSEETDSAGAAGAAIGPCSMARRPRPQSILLLAPNDTLADWFICDGAAKPQSDAELGAEPGSFSAMSTTAIEADPAKPATRAAEAAPGGWRDILLRVGRGSSEDRILLVAGALWFT